MTLRKNPGSEFNYSLIVKLLVTGLFLIQISLFFIDRMPGLYEEWDGYEYLKIANYFKEGSFKENIGSYQVQRILISFLLFLFSVATKTEISELNTFNFYFVFNIFCTVVSIWCFFKISERYKFSNTTKLFGFSGIFYSFFNLKMSSFYPVLLDQAAFTIGFVLLYSILFEKFILSYLTIFLGSFTFPTILPFGLLLTAFSGKSFKKHFLQLKINNVKSESLLNKLAIYLIPFISSLFYLYLVYRLFESNENSVYKFSSGKIIDLEEYWPSAIISASMIFLFSYHLITLILRAGINKKFYIINILSSIIIFIGIKAIYKIISNNNISQGILWFPVNIIKQSIQFPLVGLTSHINYYGPLIFLCIIFHKELLKSTIKQGTGWFLFFFFNLALMMLGSESRQFVFFIPFCSVMILKVLNHRITEVFHFPLLMLHVIICLLFSKFWWKINVAGFAQKVSNLELVPDFNNAIIQRYFIFHAPWINFPSYLIISSTAAVLAVFYFFIFKNSPKKIQTD